MSQKKIASGALSGALGGISFKKKEFSHLQGQEDSRLVTGDQVKTHPNPHWNQLTNPGAHRERGFLITCPHFKNVYF